MSELMQSFLSVSATPEYRRLLTHVYDAVNHAGSDTADNVLDPMIAAEEEDRSTTMDRIRNVLESSLEVELNNFGVETEGDLRVRADILTALVDGIATYGDPDRLDAILSMDEDNEVILADILELSTAHHSDELLSAIKSASSALLNRIQTEISSQTNKESNDDFQAKTRDRYMEMKNFVGGPDPWLATKAIEDGARFGMSFSSLISTHLNELSAIDDPSRRGLEIFAFALASSLPVAKIPAVVSYVLESLGTRPEDMAKATTFTRQQCHQMEVLQ